MTDKNMENISLHLTSKFIYDVRLDAFYNKFHEIYPRQELKDWQMNTKNLERSIPYFHCYFICLFSDYKTHIWY